MNVYISTHKISSEPLYLFMFTHQQDSRVEVDEQIYAHIQKGV